MNPIDTFKLKIKVRHQLIDVWAILKQSVHIVSQILYIIYWLYLHSANINGDLTFFLTIAA